MWCVHSAVLGWGGGGYVLSAEVYREEKRSMEARLAVLRTPHAVQSNQASCLNPVTVLCPCVKHVDNSVTWLETWIWFKDKARRIQDDGVKRSFENKGRLCFDELFFSQSFTFWQRSFSGLVWFVPIIFQIGAKRCAQPYSSKTVFPTFRRDLKARVKFERRKLWYNKTPFKSSHFVQRCKKKKKKVGKRYRTA